MCNHCGCGGGWSQPVIPAAISGLTSFTAPYAGSIARPFADKMGDIFSAADLGFLPSNTGAANVTAWNKITAAALAKGGGDILIPAGTYHIAGPLVMSGLTATHVYGTKDATVTNVGGVTIIQDTQSADIFQINACVTCSVKGLRLSYSGASGSTVYAFRMQNNYRCMIERCCMWPNAGTLMGNGILVERTSGQTEFRTTIKDCTFADIADAGVRFKGFDVTYQSGGIISGGFFINCAGGGAICEDWSTCVIQDGAEFFGNGRNIIANGTAPGRVSNIVLLGIVIDSAKAENIWLANITRCIINSCWVSVSGTVTAGSAGIYVTSGCQQVDIMGNIILLSSGSGVKDAATGTIIDGNVFHENGSSLDLSGTNAKIVGNAGTDTTVLVGSGGTNTKWGANAFAGDLHELSDRLFYAAISSSNPVLNMDTNDFFQYSRASNIFDFVIGGTSRLWVQAGSTDETGLLVRDETAGTMKRVTRGAVDSGGSGYRVLRIPN